MSLRGVMLGLDDLGNPKQGPIVFCPAVAAAVERVLPHLQQFPYLLQTGLAMLNKYNQFPCPCPVIENQSLRHFAEMIVSLLAFHGLDPDLLAQYPTALQVIQDWSCRMRTPRPALLHRRPHGQAVSRPVLS